MNKNKVFNQAIKKGLKNTPTFFELGAYVVDNHCTMKDGAKIVGMDRIILATEFASDMAIGSQLTKRKYILTGVVIGSAVTIAVIYLSKKFKKKK